MSKMQEKSISGRGESAAIGILQKLHAVKAADNAEDDTAAHSEIRYHKNLIRLKKQSHSCGCFLACLFIGQWRTVDQADSLILIIQSPVMRLTYVFITLMRGNRRTSLKLLRKF